MNALISLFKNALTNNKNENKNHPPIESSAEPATPAPPPQLECPVPAPAPASPMSPPHPDTDSEEEEDMEAVFRAEIRKATVDWIRKQSTVVDKINWDRDRTQAADSKKRYLLNMPVQAGKTRAMIAMAQGAILKGINAIVLVQNLYKDCDQLSGRILAANRDKVDFIRHSYQVDESLIPTNDLMPVFVNSLKKIQGAIEEIARDTDDAGKCERARVIICLANGAQMKKLNAAIEAAPKRVRYMLIMDEADTEYKGATTGFMPQMRAMYQSCDKFIGVTATAFDTLVKDGQLKATHAISMPPPDNYKGIEYLTFRPIEFDSIEKYQPQSDPNLMPEYRAMATIQPRNIRVCINRATNLMATIKHPVICLHKTSTLTATHEATQQYFRDHPELANWTSIVHNGDGIRLYSRRLLQTASITVKYYDYGKMKDKQATIVRDAAGYFSSAEIQVSDILQWLQTQKAANHPHIVIIAGILADRGTSYVSSSYSWHLTHEYLYLPSDNIAASHEIQALRICGCSDDDLPRTLITTPEIMNNCRKALRVQSRWMVAAQESVDSMHDTMKATQIPRSIKPNIKMSRFGKEERKLVNVVDDEKVVPAQPAEEDGYVRRVVYPEKFSAAVKRHMDHVIEYMNAHKNQWIPRATVIDAARKIQVEKTGGCDGEKNYQATMVNIVNSDTVSRRSEYNCGLQLMRNGQREAWYVRLD